jgi:hypothetical protein
MTNASLVKAVRREEEGFARWLRVHSEDEHDLTPTDTGLACSCGSFLAEPID